MSDDPKYIEAETENGTPVLIETTDADESAVIEAQLPSGATVWIETTDT